MNSDSSSNPRLHNALSAVKDAAPSTDPPAKPAAIGICFSSRIAAPSVLPVWRSNTSAARITRFVGPLSSFLSEHSRVRPDGRVSNRSVSCRLTVWKMVSMSV